MEQLSKKVILYELRLGTLLEMVKIAFILCNE